MSNSKLHSFLTNSSTQLIKEVVLVIALVAVMASPALAANAIQSSTLPASKAPQGSTKVPMLYFNILATGDDTVRRVGFSNVSPTVKFGTGVKVVYIYQDNGDGQFDSVVDTLKGNTVSLTSTAVSSQNIQFSAPTSITSGRSEGFFVVYDLDTSAQAAATTNLILNYVESTLGTLATNVGGNVTSNTITVTGIAATANSIAPTIVLPNQTLVPMLRLTLTSRSEDMNNNDISITVQNESNNFAITDGSTNGVTTVYLYADTNSNGIFDPTIDTTVLKQRTGSQISSVSTVTFSSFLPSFTLSSNTPKDLFVVYDIGKGIPVSTDAKVKAQVISITGTGSDSGRAISLVNATPVTPASSKVAGLVYSDVTNVVPSSNFSRGNQKIPVISFVLKSENVSVTVNTITIRNAGTIQYITNPTNTNGVTRVRLYEDTNLNNAYDETVSDTLIGSLILGNGQGQTALLAPVPIQVNGAGLNITTGNQKTIFAVYDLGIGTTEIRNASGNLISSANARLEAAVGTSNLSTIAIELSGTLPAQASPDAFLPVQNSTFSAVSIQSVSPGSALRGQVNVPMLYVTIRAEQTVTSAVFSVLNNKGSFVDDHTGVSRVSLYMDANQNSVLDSSDVLEATTSSFNTTLRADLPSFLLPQGVNSFFVTYDVGDVANTTTINIAAQLNNITATGGISAVFGGELPVPQYAATLNVTSALMTIKKVLSSITSVTNAAATFNIDIRIENPTTGSIQVTSLLPKFYLGALSGADISYEWVTTTNRIFPFTLAASTGVTVGFTINPSSVFSQGNIYVDGVLTYLVSSGNYATVGRYKSSGTTWVAGAQTYAQLSASSSKTKYDWQLPAYIDSIQVNNGGTLIPFQNYDAVPANSSLILYFQNQAAALDAGSIRLIHTATSGAAYPSSTLTSTFTRSNGSLEIFNLGTTPAIIQLGIKDRDANTLPTASMRFSISSTINIDNLLFYPSPYTVGSNLRIGFSITQPARVQLYLYNLNGIVVWTSDTTYTTVGYQQIVWNGILSSGQIIGSGMYIAKMVATDNSGNKSYAYTKLAVY